MPDSKPGHRVVDAVEEAHQERLVLGLSAEERRRQHRHEGQRDDQRPEEREEHCQRHRAEQLPFRSLEEQDRQVDHGDNQLAEHRRPPDLDRGVPDDGKLRFPRGGQSEPADAVLDHDHRAVDDEPEVDGAETHEARRDPRRPHQVRREQHRQRDRQGDDQASANVSEEDEEHADHEQPPLCQIVEHGVERPGDQFRAVVDDVDLDSGRQRSPDLLELCLGRPDDAPAVLATDHHHHPRHHFAAAATRHGPLARQRPDRNAADVANEHGHAPRGAAHHHLLDVGDALEERLAADEPLLAVLDDVAAARALVVALKRSQNLPEGHRLGTHPVGIDLNLVALGKAAVGVDVGDPGYLAHRRSDVPLEDAAELHEIMPRAADLELEDLAERGAERAELRVAMTDGDPPLRLGEAFRHELAGEHDVGPLTEDDRHQRDAEPGDAANLLDLRQSAHRQLDGVGDVAFHLQRRHRPRLGNDLHLDVDEVGHGVNGDLRGRVQPSHRHEDEHREHKGPVRQRPFDEA